MSGGPLAGTTVIELAGIGPGPFAGMMLADMGADVILVERPGHGPIPAEMAHRGKRSIGIDLKRPEGVEVVLRMVERADALIEGFRPGVTERLGIGPDDCWAENPALVYGRVTGWGQHGPLSQAAGHDINYISIAGALAHMGRAGDKPTPAINLVGDFGGGGMLLVVGVLAALIDAKASGRGQVVDAAMVDGAALQMTMIHDLASRGAWTDERGANLLDTGAPFYDSYETSDGGFVSVGALEPKFFRELLAKIGFDGEQLPDQADRNQWAALRRSLAELFASRSRDDWAALLEGTDACVAPVLTMSEASRHRHNIARGAFIDVGGRTQPAPAPRFSRSQAPPPVSLPERGQHARALLDELGLDASEIGNLIEENIVEA